MRFFIILTVAIAVFAVFVKALAIPYEDMSDFEIAKMFIDNQTLTQNEGDMFTSQANSNIVYPSNNDTWYVGELVNVTFDSEQPDLETVSIFFFDKTPVLAGGPLTIKTFPFVVPVEAVSPTDGTSLLLAVRRQNRYLQTVDSIIVKVLPGKPQ